MEIKEPPLHQPPPKVIPGLTQDPAHNKRELELCYAKAVEIGGVVEMPPGTWPVDGPVTI